MSANGYTVTEAAFAVKAKTKAVHNVIDTLLPKSAGRPRRLSRNELVVLSVALNPDLTRDAKKVFALEFLQHPGSGSVLLRDGVKVDVTNIRSQFRDRLRTLESARRLAAVDEKILGGAPVFRGTRIPVAMIANMLAAGDTVEQIAAGYPNLTEEQISLAPLWLELHPQKGRPPKRPWANQRSSVRSMGAKSSRKS